MLMLQPLRYSMFNGRNFHDNDVGALKASVKIDVTDTSVVEDSAVSYDMKTRNLECVHILHLEWCQCLLIFILGVECRAGSVKSTQGSGSRTDG
jgi:hypothetical protein